MGQAQYRLVVRQGPIPGQIFELNKREISIGRDITNDIVINDAEVSRRHAHLMLEGDRYKIEDLNSTNGTYIDGQRLIGPHLMAIGEIIMFGDNVGVVFDGEPATPDVTVPTPVDLEATPIAAIPAPVKTVIKPEVAAYPIVQETAPEIEQEAPMEAEKKPVNTWLLAGCGCLLVILLLIIAAIIIIDQPWNPGGGLYCTRLYFIFGPLGYCP